MQVDQSESYAWFDVYIPLRSNVDNGQREGDQIQSFAGFA